MKGIEAAAAGTICGEIELKTSKAGNPYLNLNLAVDVGNDDGKPQWIRAAIFGETAEQIARSVRKGDKLYLEGSLTLTQWNDAHGEVRHGLNLACWKAQKIGASAIGRNREKTRERRQVENYGANPYKSRHPIGTAFNAKEPSLEQYRREKPQVVGLNDDFRDELPF